MATYKTGLERAFFIGLVVSASVFLLWMVRDFLFPVFWAAVFAVVLLPVYTRIHRRVKSASAASLLTMTLALVLVLGPLMWIGSTLVDEVQQLYARITWSGSSFSGVAIPAFVEDGLASFGVSLAEIDADITTWLQGASAWLLSQAFAISSHALSIALQVVLMLYVLFFFLRDGKRIIGYIESHLPLAPERTRSLLERFAATSRGTLKGAVIVALAQGVLGGALFAIAGVPSAVLWGVLITFLAFLPIVGPFLIWLPTSIVLALSGAYIPALIVSAGSLGVNILMDDILRPMLVGRETRIHGALVIIAIFGGIASFGVPGIIIGPVVAAFALSCWELFKEEYAGKRVAH